MNIAFLIVYKHTNRLDILTNEDYFLQDFFLFESYKVFNKIEGELLVI